MDTRIPFVLVDDPMLQECSRRWRERLDALWLSGVPVCMADGDEGGSGDGAEGSGDGASAEGDAGKPGASGEGSSDEDDDDEDDDATKRDNELSALKRRLGEAEKARKKAERELARQTQKDQAAQGEYKEMYEAEKRRGDDLELKLRTGALDRATIAAATNQRFVHPDLVPALAKGSLKDAVDEDGEVDETLVENAVKALGKRYQELLLPPEKPQNPVKGERRPAVANGDRPAGDVAPGQARIAYAYSKAPVKQRN